MIRIKQSHIFGLKVLIHTVSLSFLGIYYYWAFTDSLGADPVKAIIHFTGMGALNLLVLTLLVSPTAKYLKQGNLIKVRRLLGLYSFSYAVLHITNYVAFDLQMAFDTLLADIIKRPYITVGFAAFILMLLLALTSPKLLQRRMGKSWQKLHNWIYLVILLACTHFIWSVKALDLEPIIYFVVAISLLCTRRRLLEGKLLKK